MDVRARQAARTAEPACAPAASRIMREPFMNAVYEAAQYVDGRDPTVHVSIYKPGEARDLPVMLQRATVATPGEIVPRAFPHRARQGR